MRPLWLVGLILFAPMTPAIDQPTGMDELRQRYEEGACRHDREALVEDLRSLRRELWREGRRNMQADFMLASCLCPAPGADALAKLPSLYRGLSGEDAEQILHAVVACRGGGLARYLPPGTSVAGVIGKGSQSEELVKHRHSLMTPEAVSEFTGRLFPKWQAEQAVASLHQRGFERVHAGSNFLVTGDYTMDELRATEALMEQVLQALSSQFGLEPPRTLVTVYLLSSREGLQRHAREVHDLTISSGTWAYTFPLDASISVWRAGGSGTVGHEVMHALLEQNLPYAPPWLNEGSAALFEEFELPGQNRIRGTFRRDHWRIPYLQGPGEVPRLGELLAMDWSEFDGPQHFQINHATAKLFAFYLQEQGRLGALLDVYKGRDLFELGDDTRLLEQALGSSIGDLEEGFHRWLADRLGWGAVGLSERRAISADGGGQSPSRIEQRDQPVSGQGQIRQISQVADSPEIGQFIEQERAWGGPELSDAEVFDQLTLTNSARYLYAKSGRDWYEWTAYIDGPDAAQGRIADVRYLLHPTFRPAERPGDASKSGHPISTSGWGVFTLRAVVTLQSGATHEYSHKLRFH